MFCKKRKRWNSYFNNVSFPLLACHSLEKAAKLWLQPLKKTIQILKKKILCNFPFLRSLPDLSCDPFCYSPKLSVIWYILCPVPACLVWWSPLITWLSESLELQLGELPASSRLNLCLTENMRSGCFLFLLEASLKGRFSLCLTCTRPFTARRTSPDRTSPSVCRESRKMLSFKTCKSRKQNRSCL